MGLILKFSIPDRLPGLNEYIEFCRRNPNAGGRAKKRDQSYVEWHISQQLKRVTVKCPVRIVYRWYEKDRRRDLDNISSYGRKLIQDALVETKILKNDGWKQITGFSDEFYVDKNRPRIEVELWESKVTKK